MIGNMGKTQQKVYLEQQSFDDRFQMSINDNMLLKYRKNLKSDYAQSGTTPNLNINKDYFERVISHEFNLLKSNPDSIKLLNRIGDIYLASGKYDKAKQYYQKAFMKDADNIATIIKLAKLYILKNNPQKSIEVLNVINNKKNDTLSYLLSISNLLLGDLDRAEIAGNCVSVSAHNYFEVINTLGLIRMLKNDNKGAIECFKKSMNLKNNYAPAMNNIALCYQIDKKIDESIKYFKEAIRLDQYYLAAYNNLFNLYVLNEKFMDAHDLMVSALPLNNKNNDIQFRIAWSLMRLNKYGEAIKEYEKVFELLPDNSNTLNNIGYCYQGLKKLEESISYFNRSIRGNNVAPIPYRNLIVLYDQIGDFKRECDIANDLSCKFPSDIYALAVLAGKMINDGVDYDIAEKYLVKACEEKIQLPSAYSSLSHIYADIFPNLDKGLATIKTAIGLGFKTEALYNNLVHLLLVNGKTKEASKYINYLVSDNPIGLATRALYQLCNENLKEAGVLFDKAYKLSSDSFKDKLLQRRYYDMACYYHKKNKKKLTIEYAKKTIGVSGDSYRYISESAQKILDSLVSKNIDK